MDEATGLYDYGARYYDPAVARWTSVDPIADRFAWVSVYNYAENEPVANIDLHGLQKYKPGITIEGRAAVTSGVYGAEFRALGAREGMNLSLDRREHLSITASYDSSNGRDFEASAYNYAETTPLGISGGNLLGGSASLSVNGETGEVTKEFEASLGLFYYRTETTTMEDGSVEKYEALGVAFGANGGIGLLGGEVSVTVEINITDDAPIGDPLPKESPLIESIDNTRATIPLLPHPEALRPLNER